MKTVRYILGCCLLLLAPASGYADACSDLQAAIAKATALKQEMQREASPFLSSPNMPARQESVCKAAENLRSHIVTTIGLMDSKCLNDEQYKNLAAILDAMMKTANGNIGLFCN
jgi:hypothetical protein